MAVNPGDGQTLWVRHEVPPGSTIFGDRQFVFIVPPDGNEAMVLNALDGSLVDRRKIPPVEQWLVSERHEPVFLGRDLLLRTNRGERMEMRGSIPGCGATPGSRRASASMRSGAWSATRPSPCSSPRGGSPCSTSPTATCSSTPRSSPSPRLADIYVTAMGDQYILVTNRQPGTRNNQEVVQPLPGAAHRPVSSGLVYGFDRRGKMLWPAPRKVENTHLVLDQPERLPIVTFACLSYRRGNGMSSFTCPILCIDKRTGRVVFRERIPAVPSALDISGDPEKHTVQLRLQGAVTLTFTDKPWQPEAKTDEKRPATPRGRRASGRSSFRRSSTRAGPAARRRGRSEATNAVGMDRGGRGSAGAVGA